VANESSLFCPQPVFLLKSGLFPSASLNWRPSQYISCLFGARRQLRQFICLSSVEHSLEINWNSALETGIQELVNILRRTGE